ncbi:hypothetical protein GCM10010991_21860 [Gemmobacter aquaticus]|uniref:Uncharacterized protein n=1 Tax=Gemmobacter aquaticus TaxID=490185 RepID=A0A917YKN7_9RHOB|nr:hypothetical protein GCM10010991_21860 [Gemmobacter aquaticus]
MEPVRLGKIQWQVMGQDTMPQFRLRPRDHLVGLRQFLDVASAGDQRVVKDLDRTDLQHVQNDLRILGIVLVPAVVQRFPRAGESDGRHELEIESRGPEGEHQRLVIVAAKPMAWPAKPIVTGRPYSSKAAIRR